MGLEGNNAWLSYFNPLPRAQTMELQVFFPGRPGATQRKTYTVAAFDRGALSLRDFAPGTGFVQMAVEVVFATVGAAQLTLWDRQMKTPMVVSPVMGCRETYAP